MSQISGANVVITGAGSGLGRLLALRVARRGGTPVLWDINADALEKVADEVKAESGRKPTTWVCDVSDRHKVYEVAKQVLADLGRVDIMVNNAGIVSGKPLLEIPDEKIELTFGVNTMSLFWTAKAFLPQMIERDNGHFVTIASAAGLVGAPKLVDYCASKHAAVGFDDALRVELAKSGSRVQTTVVCPYYIDTGMFEGVKTRFPMLLPILRPKYVINQIIDAIEHNKKRVVLPPFVAAGSILRILPTELFDQINSFFGTNASMDEFVGRKGAAAHGHGDSDDGKESAANGEDAAAAAS